MSVSIPCPPKPEVAARLSDDGVAVRRPMAGALLKGWSTPRPAMILDMGEASREEGFCLNGCR